jgi:uncharacterized repeat protein (TIGR03803 family)
MGQPRVVGLFGMGLAQAANGNFYGTTTSGGAYGYGSVFKITREGVLTTEVSFDDATNDANPYAGLVQASNGFWYGTTSTGAPSNGTVFKIENGKLTTLWGFGGQEPAATLIQATDGNLYGSTSWFGGGNGNWGTIFKITPEGLLTTVYGFCSQSCADGASPRSALVQGSDGNFYGVTYLGGVSSCPGLGCGTIFKLTPSGNLTTLYSFCPQMSANGVCPDGAQPFGLMQATDGNFYGTTVIGGAGYGTVYRLSVGLGPFVALKTAFGKEGATVKMLGTNLTGATSVTFNGTPTTFTVNSTGTAITATVPAGATTGTVQVRTPGGTLDSNGVYTVVAAEPVLSLPTGIYSPPQMVSITDATAGAVIY